MFKVEIGQIWFYKNYHISTKYKISRIVPRNSDENLLGASYYINEFGSESLFDYLDKQGRARDAYPEKGWHFKWADDVFCLKKCGLHRSECLCK